MDEALLGESGNRKFSRKSEHPFLSLISGSPKPRSSIWSDPFSPSSFQNDDQDGQQPGFYVGSPRFSSNEIPCAASSFQGDGQSRRPEFYVGSARFNDMPSSASSFQGRSILGAPEFSDVGTLHRIAEESHSLRSITGFSEAGQAQSQVGEERDLEAPSWPEERSDGDGDDNRTGFFGENLTETDDAEEAKGEKQSWRAGVKSGVTGLLRSAIPLVLPSIPDVLNPFSSSPDDDFLDFMKYEKVVADQREQQQNRETTTPRAGGMAGSYYSSLPQLEPLPDISTEPYSALEEQRLLDDTATVSHEEIVKRLSKCDTDISPSPDSLIMHAHAEKRRRTSLHRCRTAPLLTGLGNFHTKVELNSKPTKSTKQSASTVVWQASMGLCIYLTVGVIIYTWKKDEFRGIETVGVIDALYFCIVTMCTIGYGDITPVTPSAKILACALVLVGFGFIDALLSGMVTFVLDRQEHLLLTVVEDGHHERAKNYVMDAKKGRMRIRMKVALAVGTVVLTTLIGVLFLHYMENLKWVDALYGTCISITTVGYGDYSFHTVWGRLFAAVWLLLSTLGVARAFLYLAEARVHSRHRHLAKRVLQRKMTTTDLMAMDLDNDGHVSKSEFVVYKLKEMGRVDQNDVLEILKQFDFLDSMNAGKITLAQLLEGDS